MQASVYVDGRAQKGLVGWRLIPASAASAAALAAVPPPPNARAPVRGGGDVPPPSAHMIAARALPAVGRRVRVCFDGGAWFGGTIVRLLAAGLVKVVAQVGRRTRLKDAFDRARRWWRPRKCQFVTEAGRNEPLLGRQTVLLTRAWRRRRDREAYGGEGIRFTRSSNGSCPGRNTDQQTVLAERRFR